MAGARSWSLGAEDAGRIDAALLSLAGDAGALNALLIDRNGQLVASAGRGAGLDATTFGSLAAADFAANEQLAALLGEREFSSLSHQGAARSVHLADVGRRAILALLFDDTVTLGLVRIRARRALPALAALVEEAFTRADTPAATLPDLGAGWADEAEGEIDRLFGIR